MKGRVVILKQYTEPFDIQEYDVPDPDPGAILLKMSQAGICGSDLHRWRGDQSPDLRPVPPGGMATGHEGTGTISKLGPGVTTDGLGRPIKEGDRVIHTAFPSCYRCYQCLSGNPNWCPSRGTQGKAGEWPYFTGTFADYFYVRPNQPVFLVPDELPDNVLGFINCAMGTVTEGLLQAGCKEGDYVVIQGAGGLGLNAVAMAKNMGAHRVIVLDRLENRLQLAEQFGADHTINIEEFNTPETRKSRVMELTSGRGANIGMDLVGHPDLLVEGIDFLTRGGTYLEIGKVSSGFSVDFDPSTLLAGKKIMASSMYRPIRIPMMMEMIQNNMDRLPFDKIISNTFPLADVNQAFGQAEWADRQTSVTRAVLVP